MMRDPLTTAYNVHDSIAKEVTFENPMFLESGLIAENYTVAPALYNNNQYVAKLRKEICDIGIEAGGSIYGAMYSLPPPLSFEQVGCPDFNFSNYGVGKLRRR